MFKLSRRKLKLYCLNTMVIFSIMMETITTIIGQVFTLVGPTLRGLSENTPRWSSQASLFIVLNEINNIPPRQKIYKKLWV